MFTREGVEAALQGAVGSIVAGGSGRAGRRALGIKSNQSLDGGENDKSNLESSYFFKKGKDWGGKFQSFRSKEEAEAQKQEDAQAVEEGS